MSRTEADVSTAKVATHLWAALEAASDDDATYYIRQALTLLGEDGDPRQRRHDREPIVALTDSFDDKIHFTHDRNEGESIIADADLAIEEDEWL